MRIDDIKEQYGNVDIPKSVLQEALFTMKDCRLAFKDIAKTILKDFTEVSPYDSNMVTIVKYGDEIIIEDKWNDYCRNIQSTAWKPFLNELYYYLVSEIDEVSDLFFDAEYYKSIPSSIEMLKDVVEVFKEYGLLDKTYKLTLDIE